MNKELKKTIEQAQIRWLTQRLEECQELEVKYNNLKEKYNKLENEYVKTLGQFRAVIEVLDECTYADVEKKIDEILKE